MNADYLDIGVRFPTGRRAFLFIERAYFVLADISFGRDGVRINTFKRFDFRAPFTEEGFEVCLDEIGTGLKSVERLPRRMAVTLPSSFFDISILQLPDAKRVHLELLIRNKLGIAEDGACIRCEPLAGEANPHDRKRPCLVGSVPSRITDRIYRRLESLGYTVKLLSHPLAGIKRLIAEADFTEDVDLTEGGDFAEDGDLGDGGNLAKGDDAPMALHFLLDAGAEPVSLCVFDRGDLKHIRFLKSLDVGDTEAFVQNIGLETNRTVQFCQKTYYGSEVAGIWLIGMNPGEGEESGNVGRRAAAKITETTGCRVGFPRMAGIDRTPGALCDAEVEHSLLSMCGLYLAERDSLPIPGVRRGFDFISSSAVSRPLAGILVACVLLALAGAYHFTGIFQDRADRIQSDMKETTKRMVSHTMDQQLVDRIGILESCVADWRNAGTVINGTENRIALPVLVVLENLPSTARVTSINFTVDERPPHFRKILTFKIQDDFRGAASLQFERSVQFLRQSGLFADLKYEMQGGAMDSAPRQKTETVKLELELENA